MKRTAILLFGLLFGSAIHANAAAIRVADGDSFSIGKQRFRLYGIDAPELHQDCRDAAGKWWPCGKRARDELRKLIGGNAVQCAERTRDRFGRAVATCQVGGRDIAEDLVLRGFATAYPDFASPYGRAESEARAARRGLWAGTFERPRAWRDEHPREGAGHEPSRLQGWLREKAVSARETVRGWFSRLWGREKSGQ